MAIVSITIAIMTASSAGSPTPGDFSAPLNDALFSPLNVETDRALTALSETDVNTYIQKQISSMQRINNVTVVQTQITNNLQKTYGQYNWLVFVAQDFNPPKENVSINYFGKGMTSNVIVPPWTVYWTATPPADTDSLPVNVNEDLIRSQLFSCSSTTDGRIIASTVYECMKNTLVSSERSPVAAFMFLSSNPGPNVSIGNSLRLKAFSIRITITCTITITIRIFGRTFTYVIVIHF